MLDSDTKSDDTDISLSGQAIALAVAENDSLAGVLQASGMEMRDFIVLSFVSDQRPIDTERLARLIGLDRNTTLRCIERLIDAGLVVSDAVADGFGGDVDTTDLGNRLAKKMLSQL